MAFSFNIRKLTRPVDYAEAMVDTGRRPGTTTGSYIDDLCALHKAIWLCDSCKPKWNMLAYGYMTRPRLPRVRGFCDGCREGMHQLCTMFVHKSFHIE